MATKKSKKMARKTKFTLKPKAILIIAVVALFAGVGAYLLFSSKAAGPVTNPPAAPSVYLSPTTQPLGINQTFVVELRTNSGTTAVNAVQANFTYPTSSLTWVSTDYATSAYSVQAENTVNATTGQVTIVRGASGGTSLTGDQLVAKLTFTSKTTGGAANLTFTAGTALLAASNNANILPGTSAYGNATYTIDTVAPTVSITSPAASANVELGSTQTISATSADATSDVTKVEFYVDGVLRTTDTTSPYSYAWPTAGVTLGSHSLTARSYDTYNNNATSTAVSVTVRDSTAPTVSITAPTAGSTLSNTVSVNASASDNTNGTGLTKVEFYVDGVLKSTDTTSPYSYSWDTKTATDASHSLTTRAYDAATTPNVTTSTAVAVTVDNTDKVAPSAPTGLQSTGNTFTSISLSWNASTDNVGVTGYRLTRNGTTVYNGTARTYTDSGLTAGTSYTYAVVAYDAANNNSTATTITASAKAQKTGDVNSDDLVDVYDLSILLSNWGTSTAGSDINKDGTVNVYDLSILLSNWGL